MPKLASNAEKKCNGPLNNITVNCVGPFIWAFFSINIQSTFCDPGCHIYIFNQPQIENSIFGLKLKISGCGGPTVCTVLHHFTQGIWTSTDLVSLGVLGPMPPWHQKMTSFWRVKSYMGIFGCMQCVGVAHLTLCYSRANCTGASYERPKSCLPCCRQWCLRSQAGSTPCRWPPSLWHGLWTESAHGFSRCASSEATVHWRTDVKKDRTSII